MNAHPVTSLFTGWPHAFAIDEVLEPDMVFAAHDQRGARYLIAHTTATTWLCAPVTVLALARIASGDAELRDAFMHSATGTVEKIVVHGSVIAEESLTLCCDLSAEELPSPGVRLCWPARCA